MMQSQTTKPTIAKEVLWTYRSTSEEEEEKNFFTALEVMVATEIKRRMSGDGRIWVGREVRLRVGAYTIHARLTNVEPLLATAADDATEFLAQYRERPK